MNEQICLLWEQAAKTTQGDSWEEQTKFMERFAQLIVAECIDIASEVRGEPATDTHYVIGYNRACEKMISGIKEHFGVEE